MKLTAHDLDTLDRAVELRRRFDAGIFPTNGGDRANFRRLVHLGLLAYAGPGRDVDGGVHDVDVYRLTSEGEQATVGGT